MAKYTITQNNDFNSIEIAFAQKPTETIREALKALKFRWHAAKKVWYGYTDEETVKAAINNAEQPTSERKESAAKEQNAEKTNDFGVKIGDIFEASWGYEQTNVDFFQVVALVGKTSVRVREVHLPMIDEAAVNSMSSDRTYEITSEILPAAPHSVFIKDQENGDLKRLQPGWNADPEQAKKNCFFRLSSFANAHKCNGNTVKTYESWYA